MKPLEILSALPPWSKASPDSIVDSPAFAMPCRLGDASAVLRRAAVEPAASDSLPLRVSFGDEPHVLRLGRSSAFPDLDAVWESRADVPAPLLLALVEKECGSLFQMLENAVRKQLRLVGQNPEGDLEPTNPEFLDFQVVPADGSAEADDARTIVFSLSRSASVVSALGVLRNIDHTHESVRGQMLPAETEYASFTIPEDDLSALAPGDAVLIPELESAQPKLVVDGRFTLDAAGVSPLSEDALAHVRAAAAGEISLGQVLDAAGGEEPKIESLKDDGSNPPLRIVRNGATIATGSLGRLGDQTAFFV